MVCSIVQPEAKFRRDGCPNCDEFLELRGNQDAITDCTSQVFEGLITMADTETSWVAKWQRLQGYAPGTYAVKVVGIVCKVRLECRVLETCANEGQSYRKTSLPWRRVLESNTFRE